MKKFILCTFLAVSFIMSAQSVIAECEPFFTGGGIITEGHGKNTLKITFAVNLFIYRQESRMEKNLFLLDSLLLVNSMVKRAGPYWHAFQTSENPALERKIQGTSQTLSDLTSQTLMGTQFI